MTKTALEIRWWIFEEISNRADKYHWVIDCTEGATRSNGGCVAYVSMIVGGEIIGETEKAVKVSLDYRKGYDETIYNGFVAWIPKKAILNRLDSEESDGYEKNMPCDNSGFCCGTACPQYFICHG